MSIKSIISCCKYQLYRMRFIPLFFAVWSVASILFSATIRSIIDKVPFSLANTGSGSYDMFMGVIIFVYMCIFMTDFFNTAAANGASRTTACVSSYISSIICSFVSAVEVSVFSPIVSCITGNDEVWGASLYGHALTFLDEGWSMFAVRLRYFGICLFCYIAICAFVMLLTSLLYRLPNWIALTIMTLMVFIPTAGIYLALGEKALILFWYNVAKFIGIGVFDEALIGNALQGAAVFIGLSLILLLLSCLITRHSSAKPLAIKSD